MRYALCFRRLEHRSSPLARSANHHSSFVFLIFPVRHSFTADRIPFIAKCKDLAGPVTALRQSSWAIVNDIEMLPLPAIYSPYDVSASTTHFPLGTSTVTLTATDVRGLQANCSTVVEVLGWFLSQFRIFSHC